MPTAFVNNDGGNNGSYWCSATNTWTQITSGGGGAGVKNPSGNEFWVGTGYTFTTVDALTETLTGGNYMIHDTNCTGTNGVGDDWTVDPFNPTTGNNLHLIVTYGPCKYPLASEVPVAIGQSSALILYGDNGIFASTFPGGVIIAGPSFPGKINSVGPTLGSGAFGSVSATSSGCGGHTFGTTTTIDIEAEYYQLAPTNGLLLSGVNGVTLPGVAQTSLTVNSGQCATYTAPSSGSFVTNAVGMSLFATVHAANSWAWEGNVAPSGTITFPTAQGVTNGLNPSPDPTGYNTSGALVYMGRRNENASISGNLQFGITFQGAIDANGLANGCLINVGGEELSAASKAVCRNPAGQFGFLVEGYNGSVTTPNSSMHGLVYDASSCSVSHPCGGYPGAGSITTAQEATISSIIIDQLQSFRGIDDVTATPDTASGPTLYDLLVVGTTAPEATVAGTGTLVSRFHGEGPASGSHLLAHIKSCGAGLSVLHVNGNSKNVVDLDDLQSAACQTAAPNAYAGATPFSQPSYASDLSDVVPYASTSAVKDNTTGYSSTAGAFLAHYWVGNSSTAWCSSVGNTCGTMSVAMNASAGTTWGTATGVGLTVTGDSHGSDVVDLDTHSGGNHSGPWVDGNGNFFLATNPLALGVTSQATQSNFTLFGSASGTNTNPGYILFKSNDGTLGTALSGSGLTTAGTLCTSTGVPTGACNPSTASKHEIVTFATGTAPTSGDCAKFTVVSGLIEIGDSLGACGGGGGSPGGSTTQYQINNAGSFGGNATFANTAAAGTGTILINQSTSDIPALRVTGFTSSPASDVFQVASVGSTPGNTCASTTNCAIWVDASNNFNTLGNTWTFSQTATAGFLRGSAANTGTAPFYIDMFQGSGGSTRTTLFSSSTVQGLPCTTTTVPAADCTTSTALSIDPLSAADQVVGSGSGTQYGSLGVYTPAALTLPSCSTSASALNYSTSSHTFSCNTSIVSSTALSSFTAATASNTIASGNNPQTWNWAQTSNNQAALTLGETSLATGGTITNNLANQNLFKISTGNGSAGTDTTENPFSIAQGTLTGSNALPIAQFSSTWNNGSTVFQGLVLSVTNTASSGTSDLLNLFAGSGGTTSEFSVTQGGAVTANSTGTFGGVVSGSINQSVGTGPFSAGGKNFSGNSAGGLTTIGGSNQTGTGGSLSFGGNIWIEPGNNSATSTSSSAGGVEIGAGQSIAASNTGQQGLYAQYFSYAKGATVTLWNVQCFSSTMTTADCGASPGNWIGIAEVVGSQTVQVIASGLVPVNSSNSAVVGHTFCAGSSAGQGTDSGGTTACALGSQIGIVADITTSRVYKYPDGTSVTISATLPLIQIARD